MLFGEIQLAQFAELGDQPQKIASAAAALKETKSVGVSSYKAVMYCGTRVVRGVNYVFIAEETTMDVKFDMRKTGDCLGVYFADTCG